MKQHTSGFSLVELLVAIAVFAIMMTALTYTIMGILGVNRASQQQLASSSKVQNVVEQIKVSWSAQNPGPQPIPITPEWTRANEAYNRSKRDYSNACAPIGTLPTGMVATVQSLDKRGGSPSAATPLATDTCPSTEAANAPRMRRVTLVAQEGNRKTEIVLDLVQP